MMSPLGRILHFAAAGGRLFCKASGTADLARETAIRNGGLATHRRDQTKTNPKSMPVQSGQTTYYSHGVDQH